MPLKMSGKPANISVVGLGKLGCPIAACLASKGHRVIGVDLDPAQVGGINQGLSPIFEPGLQPVLEATGGRLTATTDIQQAIRETQITFVVVPTPSEADGGFSLNYVLPVCEAIGAALRDKPGFHLVALTSTVMPGQTGGDVRQTLEGASGKLCGTGFGLCYSPVFVALGSVIRDYLNPDFVLIGESDARSGDLLESLLLNLYENSPAVARMNFVNSELAKLAVNTFVTTKITFGNMLSRICERLPQADVDTVTSALGLDDRIGPKYLKGATGYGGPCFPRDVVALNSLARQIGTRAALAEATDQANREEVDRLATLAKGKLPAGGTVGILGLAYKPDTDVVEESPGLLLAQTLAAEGVFVVAYDPAAGDNAREVLGDGVRLAESMDDCVAVSDVVVISTPWDEFRKLGSQQMRRRSPAAVIDCWRILDRQCFGANVEYVALGVGPDSTDRRCPS